MTNLKNSFLKAVHSTYTGFKHDLMQNSSEQFLAASCILSSSAASALTYSVGLNAAVSSIYVLIALGVISKWLHDKGQKIEKIKEQQRTEIHTDPSPVHQL